MSNNNLLDNNVEKKFLDYLMNLYYNKKCADCNKEHPTWTTLTYAFFICSDCAIEHRKLGVLKSKVKSTQLDIWSLQELRRMHVGGNRNAFRMPETCDFAKKYDYKNPLVKELDKLTEESAIKEPDDSFIKNTKEIKSSDFGRLKQEKVIIKKIQKPRFSDIIESDSDEPDDCEKSDSVTMDKLNSPVNCNQHISEEQDNENKNSFVFNHTKKSSDNLKKSIKTSRSPFSFNPAEIESDEE